MRRDVALLKQINKSLSYPEEHITHEIADEWRSTCRLKRSSPMQQHRDILEKHHLTQDQTTLMKEKYLPLERINNMTICYDLLSPCSKADPPDKLRQLAEETLEERIPKEHTRVYTDGSSDSRLEEGGCGIFIEHPDGTTETIYKPAGRIASNHTAEMKAVLYALEHLLQAPPTGVAVMIDSKAAMQTIDRNSSALAQQINQLAEDIKCPIQLQWVPSHVGLDGNENADILAKTGRAEEQPENTTLNDLNTYFKQQAQEGWKGSRLKRTSTTLEACTRRELSTWTRLKTGHTASLRISPDGEKRYRLCGYCDNKQLSPEHCLECPTTRAKIQSCVDSNQDPLTMNTVLESNYALDIVKIVIDLHGYM
jgi:ribonuclease HI